MLRIRKPTMQTPTVTHLAHSGHALPPAVCTYHMTYGPGFRGSCADCQRALKLRNAAHEAAARLAAQHWNNRVVGQCAYCQQSLYAGGPYHSDPLAHIACQVQQERTI